MNVKLTIDTYRKWINIHNGISLEEVRELLKEFDFEEKGYKIFFRPEVKIKDLSSTEEKWIGG